MAALVHREVSGRRRVDGRRGADAARLRRSSIIESALACFTEVGYEPTTVQAIGARAGASTGSMYHFFPLGKAAIAAAVHLDAQHRYQRDLLPVLTGAAADEGVRGAVAFHLRWVRDNPSWARFLFTDHPREVVELIEPELAVLNRDFFAAIDSWLRPHIEAGRLQSLPRLVFFAIWVGPAQLLCRQRLHAGAIETISQAEAALADAAWVALRGDRHGTERMGSG